MKNKWNKRLHTPSLYLCYRTVRHEKRYISGVYSYASLLMPHCPVTVVQRYRADNEATMQLPALSVVNRILKVLVTS